MSASRFAVSVCMVSCALYQATACAADAGDLSKTGEGGVMVSDDGAMTPGEDGSSGGGDTGGGGGGPDTSGGGGGGDTGSPDTTVISGDDANGGGGGDTGALDTGGGGVDTATTPDVGVDTGTKQDTGTPPVDAGGSCLSTANITAKGCPNCQTQNASDMPICETYLSCYIANSCNPNDACGDNSGICGVNTLGGGEAPEGYAVMTYTCACGTATP